jgi:hypothetical protein
MATVMEAKMEGYTSLEDIKTFAAIAEARLGAMISKLLTDRLHVRCSGIGFKQLLGTW